MNSYLILICNLTHEKYTHSNRTLEMCQMLNHGVRELICVKKVDKPLFLVIYSCLFFVYLFFSVKFVLILLLDVTIIVIYAKILFYWFKANCQ